MASNGRIALVVDGTGLKDRFARTDNVLDRPQRLVDVSHRFGIVDSVSPQHPDAIVALLGFDLFFIDNEVAASFHFEIATIAFVAD